MIARRVLFLIVVCFSCGTTQAQHADAIPLAKAKFTTGDDASWALPDFVDTGWKDIRTGTIWQEQGYPNYHGYAWYRIHITIPATLKFKAFWKDSLRIFLAHVNDVDETFLNGVKIGQIGSFPTDPGGYVSQWPAVREYHLDIGSPAIKWGEDNVIAVRDYDGGGSGGIFMGVPYMDMLERTDGLTVVQGAIQYQAPADGSLAKDGTPAKAVAPDTRRSPDAHHAADKTRGDVDKKLSGPDIASLPLTLTNSFNTTVRGVFELSVTDAATRQIIHKETNKVALAPFDKQDFVLQVPNRPGILYNYVFTEERSEQKIEAQQAFPYTLTPTPSDSPRINSAGVYGARPGSPFLFKVAATGVRPLTYQAQGLPPGLAMDSRTGLITGNVPTKGAYTVQISASNTAGTSKKTLTIKVGDTLAYTPTMGWNSWNCWGLSVSADKVKRSAQAMLDEGLADHGWSYINIDDGWESATRADDGHIMPNSKFADMKELGDWLHVQGLKFGIYSSPGPRTCGGFLGSYQHEDMDAGSYAGWGVDYLKYHWCSYDGIAGKDTSLAAFQKPYAVMQQALRKQPRDIIYSLCQYGMKDVWKWGGAVGGQSWRTTEDIEDTWKSLVSIGFHQDPLYPYAGPGHWNDPDMMIVGQLGWGQDLHASRLTPDEQYTHVSLWCLLSAPLLIGCDLSKLDGFTLNLLTNDEVLAIDQDALGRQARKIVDRDGYQIWEKEMSDGSRVIGVFNMGLTARKISVGAGEVSTPGPHQVRDVWKQKELGYLGSGINVMVQPHGVMLLKMH